MSKENISFEKALDYVNWILMKTGLQLIDNNNDESLLKRLRRRPLVCFVLIWFNTDAAAEFAWFIDGAFRRKSLVELTYPAPCMAVCILANIKAYYFLKHELCVNDLINTLRRVQDTTKPENDKAEMDGTLAIGMSFLTKVISIQYWLNVIALWGYAILPFVITARTYSTTGKIELVLPFVVLYPFFDANDVKLWPFMYLRQMYTASRSIFLILGPDCLYYACCSYIQIQFQFLQNDLERIISWKRYELHDEYENFKKLFVGCMERHVKLIRCVSLMERVYSISTLFNVVMSSMLICLTGFNITAMEGFLIVPFIGFVFLVSSQIFLFCYFGDNIMRSSSAASSAVYNCNWYYAEAKVRKDLLFVLTRAQKPCKLTAYGFSDINLATFGRILSTAWSYFALLSTMNGSSSLKLK